MKPAVAQWLWSRGFADCCFLALGYALVWLDEFNMSSGFAGILKQQSLGRVFLNLTF